MSRHPTPRIPAVAAALLAVFAGAGAAHADEAPFAAPREEEPAAASPEDPSAPWPTDGPPYSTPYLYQSAGRGTDMSVTVQYELGYGSRESRNFVQHGLEQGLRVRFQPWSFLGVEAFGGVVVDVERGGFRGQAGAVEVIARALEQETLAVNLDLGAGYAYDYRGDHVPFLRLTLGRSFGPFDLSLAGRLEIPVGDAGRDELDIMTTLAASYGLSGVVRLGLELAGEDLEGFVESEEAEGGAKLLFGPTLALALPYGLFVKVNAAAVYAHIANQELGASDPRPDEWGFMGRTVLGGTW